MTIALVIATAVRGVPLSLTSAALTVNNPSRPIPNSIRGAMRSTLLNRLSTASSAIAFTSCASSCGSTIGAASAAGSCEAASTGNDGGVSNLLDS